MYDSRSKTVLKSLHKPNIVKSKGVYVNYSEEKKPRSAARKGEGRTRQERCRKSQIRYIGFIDSICSRNVKVQSPGAWHILSC